MQATAEPMLLTAREAARTLNLSERFLWTLTRAGEIPAVRLGRLVRYSPDDLRTWIASRAATAPGDGR